MKEKLALAAVILEHLRTVKVFYINVHPNTGEVFVSQEPVFVGAIRVVPDEVPK